MTSGSLKPKGAWIQVNDVNGMDMRSAVPPENTDVVLTSIVLNTLLTTLLGLLIKGSNLHSSFTIKI